MRRVATLLLATAALMGGCADNQETLIVLFAPLWDEEGSCTIDSATDEALLHGTLDLSFRTPYIMPALLLNNSGDQRKNNTGVESNEIQVIDAEVTLDSPQDPDLLNDLGDEFTHFTAALSTNSISPGETIGLGVEVIPQGTVNELAAAFGEMPPGAKVTVRANVVFNGTRTGNDVGKVGRVKARDFSFPINLCNGCLLYCGGCTDTEGQPNGCPVNIGALEGGVCGNAQDLPLWPSACEGPMN
ncbi:MAG TPA: hypothetical protein VG755_24740 [Nannocystaceae bacterium]|nr:hypothetical protein [Nannocystaceae bacterium]